MSHEFTEEEYEVVKEKVSCERKRIIERIKAQICFDALADEDGRCTNHKGKCYEIGLLVKELEKTK